MWTASPAHRDLFPEPIVSSQKRFYDNVLRPQPTFTDVRDLGYCFPPTVHVLSFYAKDIRSHYHGYPVIKNQDHETKNTVKICRDRWLEGG